MTSLSMSRHGTGDSFVLVDSQDALSSQGEDILAAVEPFFPGISDPSSSNSSLSFWSSESATAIKRARQASPDGKLYIDELLSLIHVEPSVYPPESIEQLRHLLSSVLESTASSMTTNCVIMYLLTVSKQEEQVQAFVRRAFLPKGYQIAIQGFAALDSGDWNDAVANLTDSRLTPDFVNKTLRLLGHSAPADQKSSLVLRYWQLAGVPLESIRDLSIVLKAFADPKVTFGVERALALIRAWPSEDERAVLLGQFLSACFGDNYTSRPVASHLKSLLTVSFNAEEDATVSTFCSDRSLPRTQSDLAVEWRLSKLVAESRAVDAVEFARKANMASDHPIVKAVEGMLTELERVTLELDTDTSEEGAMQIDGVDRQGTAMLEQPAWLPRDDAPQPAPDSLYALQKPGTPQKKITAADLPLSASPFLRAGKSLSGAQGAPSPQKAVMRAMRESSQGNRSPSSPHRTGVHQARSVNQHRLASPAPSEPSQTSRTMREASPLLAHSRARASSSTTISNLWSPASPSAAAALLARKPTLAAFGSVRAPATPVRLDSTFENVEGGQSVNTNKDDVEMDIDFATRIARDPAIAKTLEAANQRSPAAAQTGSSETRQQQSSQGGARRKRDVSTTKGTTKRRAVSKEPDDGQPAAPMPTTTTKEAEHDDADDDEDHDHLSTPGAFPRSRGTASGRTRPRQQQQERAREEETPRNHAKPRSTRARTPGSAAPAPSTPAASGNIRRSSRLATPSRAKMEQVETETEMMSASKRTSARAGTTSIRRSARSRSASVVPEEED